MAISQSFKEAVIQLPRRYEKSKVLTDIYTAFDVGVKPILERKMAEYDSCQSFETMPTDLLNRFCEYFNIDMELPEQSRRSMCAWRMTTIGGNFKLENLLDALGFVEFKLTKLTNGALFAGLKTRRASEKTIRQATDEDVVEFDRVLAEYGPAHLRIYAEKQRAAVFGNPDIKFGTHVLFSGEIKED